MAPGIFSFDQWLISLEFAVCNAMRKQGLQTTAAMVEEAFGAVSLVCGDFRSALVLYRWWTSPGIRAWDLPEKFFWAMDWEWSSPHGAR